MSSMSGRVKVVALLGVCFVVILALKARQTAAEPGAQRVCLSNLRQLCAAALIQYCQDNDEKMPPANKWCTGTYPYVRNESFYRCPADDGNRFSYAMNYKLSRVKLPVISYPAETVALFESNLHVRNAYDRGKRPGASIALPPRHNGFDNYAFADGHAKSCQPQQIGFDYYRVVRPVTAPR